MADIYSVNDAGERIIAASRRPDGTLRKERRVRAGYVPQDEQPVYQSRGVQMRQNVPKCPGMVDDDQGPPKPKTKSAAKNEKRKQKKVQEQAAAGQSGAAAPQPSQQGGAGDGAAGAAAAMQGLSLDGGEAAGEAPSIEKQVRALKKKIRQAADLAAKRAEGKALSPEEEAKLAKLGAWEEEVRQLEAQL